MMSAKLCQNCSIEFGSQVERRWKDEGEESDCAAADQVEDGAKVGQRLAEEEQGRHDGRAEEYQLEVDDGPPRLFGGGL